MPEAAATAEIETLATGRLRRRLKEPTTTIQIVRGSPSDTPLGTSVRGVSAIASGQRSIHGDGVRVKPAIMPSVRISVQTKAEPSRRHTSTGKSRMFSPATQMQHTEHSSICSRDILSPPQIQTSTRTLCEPSTLHHQRKQLLHHVCKTSFPPAMFCNPRGEPAPPRSLNRQPLYRLHLNTAPLPHPQRWKENRVRNPSLRRATR